MHRTFTFGNASEFVGYYAYAVETVLIELFQTSGHRLGASEGPGLGGSIEGPPEGSPFQGSGRDRLLLPAAA